MIKLERIDPPKELTPEFVQSLTTEFKKTGKAVWQIDFIKEALLTQSYSKCTYCECELGIESKYLEVEHFACKSIYPEDVVSWYNLLAACKRCNGKKGSHDVRVSPIINPFEEDPRQHIMMRAYRMQSKTNIGELTISLLNLNDVKRAVTARFEIGNQICDNLEDLKERIEAYEENPTNLRKSKVVNRLEALLVECLKNAPYAATAATVLHTESIYPDLKKKLVGLNLWSTEFQDLHKNSISLVM